MNKQNYVEVPGYSINNTKLYWLGQLLLQISNSQYYCSRMLIHSTNLISFYLNSDFILFCFNKSEKESKTFCKIHGCSGDVVISLSQVIEDL